MRWFSFVIVFRWCHVLGHVEPAYWPAANLASMFALERASHTTEYGIIIRINSINSVPLGHVSYYKSMRRMHSTLFVQFASSLTSRNYIDLFFHYFLYAFCRSEICNWKSRHIWIQIDGKRKRNDVNYNRMHGKADTLSIVVFDSAVVCVDNSIQV